MWEYTYKVIDDSNLGWNIKEGDTFKFHLNCSRYEFRWNDKDGNSKGYPQWRIEAKPSHFEKEYFELVSKKIWIDTRCEPYMYNTKDDLTQYGIGDVLDITFHKKNKYRVKKDYVGKTIRFKVMNNLPHEWGMKLNRLALVPVDKLDKFKKNDILFLDGTWRFEALMIDLFPCNRRPYAGWKNKTVKVKLVN